MEKIALSMVFFQKMTRLSAKMGNIRQRFRIRRQ